MNVTVCELNNEVTTFKKDWENLVHHVRKMESRMVLLPEMTFSPWFAWKNRYDPAVWQSAVKAHKEWFKRLTELAPAVVCGTAPINSGAKRLNQAFVWAPGVGCAAVHDKYHLPNEKGFWEATWYDRGDGTFRPFSETDYSLGFLICTELWFFQRAREYGRQGAHFILCPRATPHATLDKWLAGGQAAAVVSGAYCLSSNPKSSAQDQADLGGQGWIIDPEGEVLGKTTSEAPFLTLDLDIAFAEYSKQTYPRYVSD